MSIIALISCTSKKKLYKCPAWELYSESPRFCLAYSLARKTADRVFILSAKYGLVPEDANIEPYNETLKEKSAAERRNWAVGVLNDLRKVTDFEKDEFIVIAGEVYNEYLIQHFTKYWLPLKGKALGEWIPKLRNLIEFETEDNLFNAAHQLFNSLPRLNWTEINKVQYKNGIYIMFEKGQLFNGLDRIVRVGTHRAQDRLLERLKDHFVKEDANGSIFRKNIGRALLNKVQDPYLRIWDLDTSNSKIRKEHESYIDLEKESNLEEQISNYLREQITFVCFPVETEVERLRLEEGLISLLNRTKGFYDLKEWLGSHSPIQEVSSSGLWNRQGLGGQPLNKEEFERIKSLVRFGYYGGAGVSVNRTKNKTFKDIPKKAENDGYELILTKTADDIRIYLDSLFQSATKNGQKSIELVSGQIHKALGMKNRMPQVCRIMFEKMKSEDEVIHTTPSGKSSTIRIRYYL